MIPLRDENPSRTVPIVNVFLIFANVSIFIYQYLLIPGGAKPLILGLGLIPYEFSHFVDIGSDALVPVPLTVFTSMFMHGGLIHLIGNMLFLWIFGDNVEDKLGHIRYFFFYVLCGVGAALLHLFTNLDSKVPTIGASGAIAGVMGAYMILFPKARIRALLILGIFIQVVRIPAIIMIGYWMLIQVVSGLAEYGASTGGGIAWFAHIGGFISGAMLVMIMRKHKRGA